MAKLRKWCAYKKVERPYTRWSKARKKAFVKSRPGKKVIKFDMGDVIGGYKQFDTHLILVSKDLAQIRTNAIEASRITGLKKLESRLGRMGFYFRIRAVPHQVIRENALAAGAGADRLSTGMKHSFGKMIGTACQVQKDKIIYDLYVPREQENFAREVLKKMSKKLPIRTTVKCEYVKAIELTEEEKAARDAKEAARMEAADKEKEIEEEEGKEEAEASDEKGDDNVEKEVKEE